VGEVHGDVTGPSDAGAATRSVDRAALLGTSLAAVVALTFGGRGPWEWLASVVGLALLAVLLGFFRFSPDEAVPWRERLALAAVGSLCATLVVAAPLQVVLSTTSAGAFCHDVAAAAGLREGAGLPPALARRAAAQAAATADGDCLGSVTNGWLWAPALLLAALGFVVATLVSRRRSPVSPDGPR
jgi:hypothetical protein